MLILPAIDLKEGKVVRLLQGDFAKETVYHDDPVAVAEQWMAQGARWLHIVDLDGARAGVMQHQRVVGRIVAKAAGPGTRIQVGGGVRSEAAIRDLFDLGVHRVVIGTKASEDLEFRRSVLRQYGRRIVIGMDAKGARVAVRGWTVTSEQNLAASAAEPDFLDAVLAEGAKCLIYTDIARDGTMEGPALEAIREIVTRAGSQAEVIASGGVGSLEDLRRLQALTPPPAGVIVGRALYEGRFTLAEALKVGAG